MNLPEKSGRSGFTLVELLVSLVLLGLVLVPVLGAFTQILKASRGAQRRSRATLLARQHLALTLATRTYGNLTPGTQSGTYPPPNEQFEWVQNISVLPSSRPGHAAKIIRVRIRYPSPVTGRPRTIRCPRASKCHRWDNARVVARR